MDPQDAIDLSQEAIRTCIFVGGPILAASLLIGLVVSLIQSMTQLHDQSIAFVPKILLLLVVIAVGLPYLSDRMIEFTKYSLEKPVVFSTASSDDQAVELDDQTDSRFKFAWLNSSKLHSSKLKSTKMNSTKISSTNLNSAQPASPPTVTPAAPSMPILRSEQTVAQPQLRPQPKLQPRAASPFALPAYRSAEAEASGQPDATAVETKTF